MQISQSGLKSFLEKKYLQYNQPSFIDKDPVSIPHLFTKKQDVEISGLFAAILAWGQRKTIKNKCSELLRLMDNAPYDFILHHTESDLKKLTFFKHRTFNATDTLYSVYFLQQHYRHNDSLEDLFLPESSAGTVESGLIRFHDIFFSLEEAPQRTKKHIPTPTRKSTCKRMNMYLRWMVRKDNNGVDFGIWNHIKPHQLICPVDIHVDRVARRLGLISRKQTDWYTALELTSNLRNFDSDDPVKYDFALFGMGVLEKSGF